MSERGEINPKNWLCKTKPTTTAIRKTHKNSERLALPLKLKRFRSTDATASTGFTTAVLQFRVGAGTSDWRTADGAESRVGLQLHPALSAEPPLVRIGFRGRFRLSRAVARRAVPFRWRRVVRVA